MKTTHNGFAMAAVLVAGVTLTLTCLFGLWYVVGVSTGGHGGDGAAWITVIFFVGSAVSVALGLASTHTTSSHID